MDGWLTASETKTSSLSRASDCASAAQTLFENSPGMARFTQPRRPYICPFELIIPYVPANSSVLDVGCGAGLFLGLLDAAGLVRRGVGVDVSEKAIAAARQQPGARAGRLVFLANPPEASLPEGPFDVVSLIDVMHHVAKPAREALLAAMMHRLRPGGRFIYKDMAAKPMHLALANRMHDLAAAGEWITYHPIALFDAHMEALGARRVAQFSTRRLWYMHEARVYEKPLAA